MVNSGSINGVPATASHFLLTTELRHRLGFKGVVISDYDDVTALQSTYHIAPDLEGAVADAVNAGVDMAMNCQFVVRLRRRTDGRGRRTARVSHGADQPVGHADPDAEVQARAV